MKQKEVTKIEKLRIGDRFIFLSDKKMVVFQIESFSADKTAVITKSPDSKSVIKFLFRRSCSVQKEVLFIRHTILQTGDDCFLQDLQRGDCFYKATDLKTAYIILNTTTTEITLCRHDDIIVGKIYAHPLCKAVLIYKAPPLPNAARASNAREKWLYKKALNTTTILLVMLFLSLAGKAQKENTDTSRIVLNNTRPLEGFYKSNFRDTVSVYFLISTVSPGEGGVDPVAVIPGFVVRVRMLSAYDPWQSAAKFNNDSGYWEFESQLDSKREKFRPKIIIWETKLK